MLTSFAFVFECGFLRLIRLIPRYSGALKMTLPDLSNNEISGEDLLGNPNIARKD